jgi:hypothetical protein
MKMEKTKDEQHPSIKDYIPSEPIPEGYKLDRLFLTGIDGFAIEFLIPIEEKAEKAA